MRMRVPILAGVLCLVGAAPAYACNFYFASTFLRIPAKPSFGAGVNAELSDPAYYGISGDVAMRLGNNAVVQPAVGICSGDGATDPFFGGGFGYKLTQSGSMTLNLQTGISYLSYDGGDETTIPVGLAAMFTGASSMSFYAGASMWFYQDSYGDISDSNSDPVLFGGIQSHSGSLAWSLGAQIRIGDSDTDLGVVAGINMSQAASAMRRLGSVFWK